jgi:phosphoglycolate phosphatase-like HAD superfamily hydrolase
MKTKLVIFDVDGTLLDTSQYVLGAFEHALTTQNHTYDEKYVLDLGGRPLVETYQTITGKDEVSEYVNLHRSFQKEHPELSFPFKNTISTLLALKERDISVVALASREKLKEDKKMLEAIRKKTVEASRNQEKEKE